MGIFISWAMKQQSVLRHGRLEIKLKLAVAKEYIAGEKKKMVAQW